MIGSAHDRFVYGRRIDVLARHLATVLPRDSMVLDVGSGDGLLAKRVLEARPDLTFRGVDVLVRPVTHIPVEAFDGVRLPFADRAFGVVLFVDVLHHANDQDALLREAARVGGSVVIKDHVVTGWLARPTLAFMDWVGNARHGVALPYSYRTRAEWDRAFALAGLRERVRVEQLELYSWPASALFDRKLHFLSRLEPGS